MRSYDASTRSYRPAGSDELAALVRQDFGCTPTTCTPGGGLWQLRLDVAEAVGVLRCLDELAATYPDDVLGATISDTAAMLRERLERARLPG